MMIPALTNSSAKRPVSENASRPSPRNRAESSTPITGLMNPRIDTRLTGLYLSRTPQSVYAPAEMNPM